MFLLNVAKIFGHGIVSVLLSVIRFLFSLGVVLSLLWVPILLLQWFVFHRPRSVGEIVLCFCVSFACFAANVALTTLQRNMRLALDRSIAGGDADQARAPRAANDDGRYGALWR